MVLYLGIYDWVILEIKYRRKLKKLREQDPFIYD